MNENGAPHTEASAPTGGPSRETGPTRRDRAPLLWGSVLLIGGLVWLLASSDFLGRLGVALVPLVVFGSMAGGCWFAYRGNPEHRWGFLIPAGLFVTLAVMLAGEILGVMPDVLVPLVFMGGLGGTFAVLWVLDPKRTWAAYTAFMLAALGVGIFVGELGHLTDPLGGAIFLWAAAGCFLWHFLRTGKDWAIFPTGFLVTIGLMPIVEALHLSPGAVLLLGVAATLGFYYLLGRPGKVSWAGPPAIVLGALGALALLARPLIKIGIPIGLIVFGVWIIYRATRSNDENDAPTPPLEQPNGGE